MRALGALLYLIVFVGSDTFSQSPMLKTALDFLSLLTIEQRKEVVLSFESDDRLDWHYIPRSREGISLKQMSDVQRKAAHALLRAALSDKGYSKTLGVIELEAVLREIQGAYRDPDLYYFTMFGAPSSTAPWGWRFEGHHLSLNFSSVTNELVATTPAFFGANPAHVSTGPKAGLRVLKAEEELGRELVRSLDQTQSRRAIIAARAPADIVTGADEKVDIGKPEGLSVAAMTADQRSLLMQLVEEYVNNMRSEYADSFMARIGRGGIEKIHFSWAGGLEPGQGHYYRIHGPTFLIEYDNTQNNANHIHTVLRDIENDFGVDLLRRHYQTSPHHKKTGF